MPPLMQASTEQRPAFQGLSPMDQGFSDARVQAYESQTKPRFKQGLRDLRSYIRSSRGLADSGIEGSQVSGLMQSRSAELGDYASGVGQEQARMLENERQRQQARSWQVEDRDKAAAERAAERENQRQAQQAQLWASILDPVGGVVGMGVGKLLGRKGSQGVPDDLAPGLDWMPEVDLSQDPYFLNQQGATARGWGSAMPSSSAVNAYLAQQAATARGGR